MSFNIKCGKSGPTFNISVAEFDALPENVKLEVIRQGLSKMLNVTSKKLSKKEACERKWASMKEGKVRAVAGGTKEGFTGKEKSEALRLAKQVVKQAYKDQGHRISDYDPSVFTAQAREFLNDAEASTAVWEQARLNVKAAESLAPASVIAAAPNPDKVAKREAKKSKETGKVATPAGKRGSRKGATVQAI